MPESRPRFWLQVAAAILAAAAACAWADQAAQVAPAAPGERLALKIERELRPSREQVGALPVFAQGLKISGESGKFMVVEGDAELRKQDTVVKGDTITYVQAEDQLHAVGNARVLRSGDLFIGSELLLKLDERTGFFLSADYLLANDRARGTSARLDFLGPENYRGNDATYTTCGPGQDDWYMQVKQLKLDYGRDLGEASEAHLYFLGQQILYLPEMTFALNNRRKSGFLTPSFGSTINNGLEFSTPYYWNMAPNRDMTITPRLMTKRGLLTAAEMRYLGDAYKGEARAEILPSDRQTNTTRSGFNILHQQTFAPGLIGGLNINRVSDSNYFVDLSNRIAATSQTYLPRDAYLSYGSPQGYALYARTLSYQTLQDSFNSVPELYRRLPQILLSAPRRYDFHGFDLALTGEFNRFSHPSLVMGNRVTVNPSISYPMLSPAGFVIPKITWNSTAYLLSNNAAGTPDRITRNLPIMSLDSGLAFERPAVYSGKDYTQTLEPRLFYLRVPARDQSQIPVFDTGLAAFNYSQIFAENIYSGVDRIADANQLTASVASRLLDPATGRESMRVVLAQRFYFTDQKVVLPGEVPRTDRSSDLLAAFSTNILPKLSYDGVLQYNSNLKQIERVTHGVRYMPEPGRTFSASYRYTRESLEQVDFASQWRFGGGWYGVGRYNYSIRDGRVVEALGGLEYDGACWVGRVVMQRFATASQKATTGIFFQLELNGLSRLGSNPLEILRRNIPGYTKLNDLQETQPRTLRNYE